jgi:nicotinamidase-related amidase
VGDKTALVVIDKQVGMFETPGVPPVPDGERLLRNVEGLIQRARDAGAAVVHESRGIGRLVLAGMQTEYCVDTTCRRASGLGYDVALASDAHGTWGAGHLPAAEVVSHHNEVLGGFAEVVPAAEIPFGDPVGR